MKKRVLILAAIAAGFVCGRPALAENPRISLKVMNVTLAQAAQRLQEASHISVEVPQAQNTPPGDPRSAPVSFDWTDSSFARALRQLCEKFDLRVSRKPDGGYSLYPSYSPPVAAPRPAPSIVKSGLRLSVTGLGVNENRTRSLDPSVQPSNSSSLNVSLRAVVEQGDADSIAGVENVVAQDELGNLLTNPGITNYHYNYSRAPYPDEWNGSANFPAPSPKAHRLQWLEGDLVVFRSVRPIHAEVDLPLASSLVTARVGGVVIAVSRYHVLPKQEADPDPPGFPQVNSSQAADWGPSVRVRLLAPREAVYRALDGGFELSPVAVGKSGKLYRASVLRGGGSYSDSERTLWDATWIFPRVEEELVKLTWDLQERSKPEKLFSFRLLDLPLPEEPTFAPQQGPFGQRQATPEEAAARPFYEKGGATLIHPVQVRGKAAGEGALRVGLAEKIGPEWGPVRWTEVLVGPNGEARLENLKPGAYRLLRSYAPRAPGEAPAGKGRWKNAETVIQVTAGKEFIAAPLAWEPDPVARPLPASKK